MAETGKAGKRPETIREYYHYQRLLAWEALLFVTLLILERSSSRIAGLAGLLAADAQGGASPLLLALGMSMRILGEGLPWALVWLASAIGMTLNVWWGVSYHGFVKLDHKSRRALFRKMEIVHAGFVTTFLFGLGSLLLPSAVMPSENLANPISLTFAALLGYFSREAFKLLYDGFLKLLKMTPNLEMEAGEVVEGADHPLRSLTAPALGLGALLDPRPRPPNPNAPSQDAAALLTDLVKVLEQRDIRYTHELLAALPDPSKRAAFASESSAYPEKAALLDNLVRFARLANLTPDLSLAVELYTTLSAKGLGPDSALAFLNRQAPFDPRYKIAWEYALLTQGWPVNGEEPPGAGPIEFQAGAS